MEKRDYWWMAAPLILGFGLGMLVGNRAHACAKNRPSVYPFELDRYLGKWYEIARYPMKFEKGLSHVTAEYSLNPDGSVKVLNSGTDEDGERHYAEGKAKVPDLNDPARLKVSFFGPFYTDYIVMYLDQDNYSYALVGSKKDKYLWILSRTPKLPKETLNMILQKALELDYDLSRLIFTEQ